MPRETITACLITRDEELRLPAALDSVAFCDQIVVVDSGSTDRTQEIARRAGALVVENPWPGFAVQRNVALDHATGDWILEIDADERVDQELRAEIQAFLAAPPPAWLRLCALPLTDHFLGRWLRPATKFPKYRHRMFRRAAFRHDERRAVHEGLDPHEQVWPLRGALRHELASGWREAVADQRRYARLESEHVAPPAGPAGLVRSALVRPLVKVAVRTLLYGGWRDGWQGLARIIFEAAGDAGVFWLAWHHGDRRPPAGVRFGRPEANEGPVRIVAVAFGDAQRAAATEWLLRAREAGADIGLVTDAEAVEAPWVPVHICRRGPLHLLRALDAAAQARPIDAVAGSPGALALLSRLPAFARGGVAPRSLREDPGAAVAQVRAVARPD